MKIPDDTRRAIDYEINSMREERRSRWPIMREVARTYLPFTMPWLLDKHKNETIRLNPSYISSVGLRALRVQTAGLMNGVTSPTRPWFKWTIGPNEDSLSWASKKWLAQVTQIHYAALKRTNYYQVAAERYFDMGLFNVAGSQIFEDRDRIFRLQRFNTGEFYVRYDQFGMVQCYAREFLLSLREIRDRFGEANLPPKLAQLVKNPTSLNGKHTIYHYVERGNKTGPFNHPADRRPWREIYFCADDKEEGVLEISGYREAPATFPRWSADLVYGDCPAADALSDMRELIQILIKKGVALEKLVDPPMAFDDELRNQPHSTMPGGVAYIRNLSEAIGGRPLYQVQVPFQELRADIRDLSISIQEHFHNDLFRMISQLDTVRSATEIDARREEKLVLLAHFLERNENESLSIELDRTFSIMQRAGIFPDPPRELAGEELDIRYVSMLATAQRTMSTVPTERLLAFLGNVAGADPKVLDLVDFDEMTYAYASDIGAHPRIIRDTQALQAQRQAREMQNAQLEATATAATAIDGAQTLSQTDVGGGVNALQRLLS